MVRTRRYGGSRRGGRKGGETSEEAAARLAAEKAAAEKAAASQVTLMGVDPLAVATSATDSVKAAAENVSNINPNKSGFFSSFFSSSAPSAPSPQAGPNDQPWYNRLRVFGGRSRRRKSKSRKSRLRKRR